MHASRLSLAALLLVGTAFAGCNDYPVHRLLDTFEVRVTSKLSNTAPVKLDFLWVIDQSPSMCQEQLDLTRGFGDFISKLQQVGGIDAQMAVITVQQIADIDKTQPGAVKAVGQFMHEAAKTFPPNCIAQTRSPCGSKPDCSTKCVNQDCMTECATKNCMDKDAKGNPLSTGDCSDPTSAKCASCRAGKGCWKLCTNAQCAQACADQECMSPFSFTFPSTPLSSLCPAEPAQSYTPAFDPATPAGQDWRCKGPSSSDMSPPLDKYVANDNCSFNSYCWKHCDVTKAGQAAADQECRNMYEPNVPKDKQRMVCYVPGSTTNESAGCMFPPDTGDCPPPDLLPPVLDNKHLNLFHCNAMVGASQTQESSFEGGFRAAWMALDPNGPNCQHDASGKPTAACQYKQLVRDGAYLIVVFVSNDDECSVNLNSSLDISTKALKDKLYGNGADIVGWLPKDDMKKCQQLGDAVGGNEALNEGYCEYRKSKDPSILCPSNCRGKTGADWDACMVPVRAMAVAKGFRRVDARFAPVSEFVNRFKSLKPDPSHVLVASITGDALPVAATATTDEGKAAQVRDQQRWDQATYFRSLIRNVANGQSPYICAGAKGGTSGFGSRYIQLAQGFGANGLVESICGVDFAPALNSIADLILRRTTKMCLTQPPYTTTDGTPRISLIRTRGAQRTSLVFGKDYVIKSSPDCLQTTGEVPGESEPCLKTKDCAAGLRCVDRLCKRYAEAVFFTEVQEKGDEIEMNYEADMGL